ncbi:MAG: DUF4091 domain-containing protein [Clostridia bacterium]|nr:DUF4091 domain-containing protein [Clostridia bacterium]
MKKLTAVFLILAMITAAIVFPVNAETSDPSDTYTHTDAANEDPGISLWFDYATEKVNDTTVNNTGKESFSVYMAKNEIENAQFVLYSETGRTGLTAELSEFSDGAGNTLDADIYIELYQDCDSFGNVPDPIPPLSAYGSFDLAAGKTQAFLVKIKTAETTAAGWYEADVTVKNSAGEAVKVGKVFVCVWNFALSEETACATSINLDYGYINRLCDKTNYTANELYVKYYDYLLENRVSAYYLPYQLYNSNAVAYMDNPRVTSFQTDSFTGMEYSNTHIKRIYETAFAGHPERFDKAYFFSGVVDAATPADLEALRSAYNDLVSKYGQYQPDYADKPFWFINTYINDIDYTREDGSTIDQIEYYNDFVNLWCSKTFAYTDATELTTAGAKIMQPLKWNSVYGTFKDRMAAKREAGQKVWWFISWDVEAPYINYYIQTDGVAQRVLFWQQFDNDVQGFLYNFVNFWYVDGSDPYNANITNASYPDAHGESILIYPGSTYGLDTPVGSLRLEAMRDGIEDYQLFHMLEEIRGEGAADKYIDRMTTGMVTYSVSDEEYYNARKALGTSVENAVNGIDDPVDPVEPTYTPGDADGDEKLTAKDVNLIKKMLSGKDDQNDAADVNEDGKLTVADVSALKRLIAGA